MSPLVVFGLSVVAFAVVLRFWLYVDLEDGLVIGAVFCGIVWFFAHLTITP